MNELARLAKSRNSDSNPTRLQNARSLRPRVRRIQPTDTKIYARQLQPQNPGCRGSPVSRASITTSAISTNTSRYYSYGANFKPYWYSAFRQSHAVIENVEGPNDGMVSVASSKWGTYKGTLVGVSHLDLINWTNRLRWWLFQVTGNKQK